MEEWRPIAGFEGRYEISSFGRVKSLSRTIYTVWKNGEEGAYFQEGRILSLKECTRNSRGYQTYKQVCLSDNGKHKYRLVHRVVAEAFIPNPEYKPQINHIDGNPSNNNVENLEWCTAKENQWHSLNILKNDPNITKKRLILCVDTREVFPSIREAQRVYGKNAHIWEAASGRRKKAANKKWMFIKEKNA